jgi:hypothetical protein
VLLAIAVFATWPLITHFNRFLYVDDVFGAAWDLWWVKHAVLHLENPWFTHQLLAPEGSYLSFHTLYPLAGFVLIPVTAIIGAAQTVNVMQLLLPIAATLGCRALAREIGLGRAAAWVAGGIYGFSIIVDWRTEFHLNFGFGLPLLPVCALFALRYDRTRSTRDALLAGASVGLLLLVDPTIAMFAVLGVGAYLLVALASGREWRVWLRFVMLAIPSALLIGSPQLYEMARSATAGGYQSNGPLLASNWVTFETNVLTMLSPGNVRAFIPGHLANLAVERPRGEAVPAYGWGALGLTLSLLLLIFVARRRPVISKRVLAWALLVFLGASWLALGPQFKFDTFAYVPLAFRHDGQLLSPLMPYTWFVKIPGLEEARVPSRFTMLGMLPLAILAGAGFAQLRSAGRWGLLIAGALVAFALLESGYPDGGGGNNHWVPLARTHLYAPVKADHSRSIVVDVPLGFLGANTGDGASPGQMEPMLRATEHEHPIAEAYLSRISPELVEKLGSYPLYYSLIDLQGPAGASQPSPASPALARASAQSLDARWVVVWPAANRRVLAYLRAVGYRQVTTEQGILLYKLQAPHTSAYIAPAPKILEPTQQAQIVAIDHLIETYCRRPASQPPSAVTTAVSELISIYHNQPEALAPGPLLAGQTTKQILADFGGLLQERSCAPSLASKISGALDTP